MGFARRTDSKYKAKRTEVDGIVFDSKREAARYQELKLLQKAGEIRALLLQPVYRLYVRPFVREDVGERELIGIGKYVGDFQYEQHDDLTDEWLKVVEDCKGFKTPVYRLKKRFVEALYGIQIRET